MNELISQSTDDELRELLRDVVFERDTKLTHAQPKQYVGQYYDLVTAFGALEPEQKDRINEALKSLLEEMRDRPDEWLVKSNHPESEVGTPAHDLLLLTMWIGESPHCSVVRDMLAAGTFKDENPDLWRRLQQVREWMQYENL